MEYLIIVLMIVNIVLAIILLQKVSEARKTGTDLTAITENQEKMEKGIREEIALNRKEIGDSLTGNLKSVREELNSSINTFTDSIKKDLAMIGEMQKGQLNSFGEHNKTQLESFAGQLKTLTDINLNELKNMRSTIENKLAEIQKDNSEKLDQMRQTVDEKLQSTLEKRLGESFNTVSTRLEALYKQLGEVQNLANGVDDLKKALMNVKTRGMWGEVQLGSIIEEILTPEQYDKNVVTKKGSNDRVEYAIKLPGQDETGSCVWLPIDAKFPQEDYQRLIAAQEMGDKDKIEEAAKQLELTVKAEAKDIRDKYLDPPNTTDFGIMFLPTESLYAEVARRVGLLETIQREYRVVISSPTTFAALLNSLQMGFRTLAIEKRSSEIWSLLRAIKTEFGKFGVLLEAAQKKIQTASKSIETAASKSRTIARKLEDVQELPSTESVGILGDVFTKDEEDAG